MAEVGVPWKHSKRGVAYYQSNISPDKCLNGAPDAFSCACHIAGSSIFMPSPYDRHARVIIRENRRHGGIDNDGIIITIVYIFISILISVTLLFY